MRRAAAALHRFTMPPGSALRVDGAAAGPVCKHALPRATARRVSLTFRRVSAATRQKLEALDAAAAEAASARAARRRARKLERGRVPLHAHMHAREDQEQKQAALM